MTLGFRGYMVGNAFTPPNRTRVNILPWTMQWHCVSGNFVIVYSVLGSLATWKTCTCPHIIVIHLNQHNFTYKYSYHIVSQSMVMTSTFITIILWLFHSPLTCRLVYNANSCISMHYHHVNAFNHNLNSVSTYPQLSMSKFSS